MLHMSPPCHPHLHLLVSEGGEDEDEDKKNKSVKRLLKDLKKKMKIWCYKTKKRK